MISHLKAGFLFEHRGQTTKEELGLRTRDFTGYSIVLFIGYDKIPAMSPERAILNNTEKFSSFISGITGLQISKLKAFPELDLPMENPHSGEERQFTYELDLGGKDNHYKIAFAVVFCDRYTPGIWLPDVKWEVIYNDKEILDAKGAINTSQELKKTDFSNRVKIHSLITKELEHAVGGPDTEIPFMNYETYSLASLKGEYRYFENIYLALMTHMKEKSLPMPPILSKRDYIREPMLAGDIQKINKVLSTVISFEGSTDKRVRAHMEAEAEVIRKHALWEAMKKNLDIPLEDAFPYAKVADIKEGRSAFGEYSILAVENDLRNYGFFPRMVLKSMEADGRYKGSKVISEFNLPACIEICKSGRIDVILFDWSNPSPEEVWMVKSETTNSFYEMYHGKAQTVLSLDDQGIQAATPDGKLLDWEATKKESERVDIRNKWMDMITVACEQSGVEPPPFFTVRSTAEFKDIAKIVSQKLGKPVSP